ncbi:MULTISPECIES: DUF3298 and DUF4163 domain-containing protein [unclassified Clostridium]|jgi:hypothetical protein|uniref:DUF3298 and DUF4163 domain-containing protein n=2 Tax=Bacillota TaxID=1239 RepID=UPI000E4724F0|nr:MULTISPECIES: DUF3298 and DUF4163 domain-containing protein [unclassified Clostridium]RHP46700.1 DUF3298 domain-containing protein [Clostridium sp. AF32-12BH]RHS88424.1 DUF3298 domain-containing protein [Clostridium sp. AM42-4]RHV88418.1 DUF3298 domain-containing protein [Clostridium sp. OF09-36]
MKKQILMMAAAVMAASCMAGGCGKKAASVERISGEERNHDADPAAQEPESGTDAEEVPESESDRQNETSGTILLEIPAEYDGEWEDGKSLISVKTSQVHLLDENHPELQKSLDALNQKNLDAQKAFLEENREDARMMYQTNPEMMENNGWESELTVTAVRAAERVLCLMQTEYTWLGGAHPYTYITGITYDTKTGEELSLEDIAADYDGIYDYVCTKLPEENDPDMFFEGYEDTVKAMFYGENADYSSIRWFLTDEGVTIWFNQYDIAPYAAGPVSVEIPFAEGLVKQQYGTQKTSYVKELPENGTADVDVDGDGKKESVSYTVDRDEYGNGGAITVTCGDTSYSTAFLMEQDYGASGGYSSEGCILHTEEGKTYLYLQHQDDNDIRYLNLFDLSTGTPVYLTYCGRAWYDSPITDPEHFILWDWEDVLGTYSAYRIYHVGEDGVPASDGTLFRLGPVSRENPIVLVSTRDLEVTVVEKNAEKPETIPSGSSFTITGTDGMSFVEAELDDGRTCRIPVRKGDGEWEWKINGVSEYDCFEQIPYAG